MQLIYYDDDVEALLAAAPRSLFLAGPTARGVPRTPWRSRAVELLEELGYPGLVVIPEFRDGQFDRHAPEVFGRGDSPAPALRQRSFNVLRWETCGIERSTSVLFWMPFNILAADDPASLPGFTTRAEVSRELARDPARLVLGMPRDALAGGHIRYHAHAAGVRVFETLEETVGEAARARKPSNNDRPKERRNVLFVCSKNQWRSPTAEQIWRKHPLLSVRSAGTSASARRRVSVDDVSWADVILVMEEKHKSRLVAEFTRLLEGKPIHVLDIPDEYRYMDPELVEQLEHSVGTLLGLPG